MNKERPLCSSCHWWLRGPGDGVRIGVCHRWPPTHSQRDPSTVPQPTTKESDWCGEHKAAEGGAAATDEKAQPKVPAYMADANRRKERKQGA